MRLYYPLDKIYITQGFGSWLQFYRKYGLKGHNGIDFRVRFVDSPMGRRYVSASADGVVETVRWDVRGYGVHIRLRHSDGSMTLYGHLTRPYVQKGDKIKAQQIIGLTGNTGDSTGPHLHWEYRPARWEKHTGNGYAGAVDPFGDAKKGWPDIVIKETPRQFWA